MSNETLAIQVQRGDTEAVLPLWEAVERFVWREARRWARAWERLDELQDLVQSGFLALYGACETYKPERGKFLTWYGLYLRTAFSETLGVRTSKRDPLQRADSLDVPIYADDPDGGTLEDTVRDPVDVAGGVEEMIYLQELHSALGVELDRLPREQADVVRGIYFDKRKRTELAQGGSYDRVRQLERKALETLRRSKELKQFVEYRTNYYRRGGPHSIENTVVHRENMAYRFFGLEPEQA